MEVNSVVAPILIVELPVTETVGIPGAPFTVITDGLVAEPNAFVTTNEPVVANAGTTAVIDVGLTTV